MTLSIGKMINRSLFLIIWNVVLLWPCEVSAFCTNVCRRSVSTAPPRSRSTNHVAKKEPTLWSFKLQTDTRLGIGLNFFASMGDENKKNKNDDQQPTYDFIDERQMIEPSMLAFLILPPIVGFLTWGEISHSVSYFFDRFNNFQVVDGNAFASDILRPTINGIVGKFSTESRRWINLSFMN